MEQKRTEDFQDKPEVSPLRRYFLWGLWLALVVFFGQNAWASVYENEVRAAMIYAGFSLLIFFGGIISYYAQKFNM